jgi:hypothetical protein
MRGLVAAAAVAAATCAACTPKDASPSAEDASPPAVASAPEIVPPAAPFNATPVAELADAANLDTRPPFEQAKALEASGQLWMARLVLERQALGSGGTKDEAELLARICQQQNDVACLDACSKKLGRKIKLEAGAPAGGGAGARIHSEPDSELARARDLVLKLQYDPARKLLEPKVLDGKASREETRMLRTICAKQGDRMCVALCDTKLR